MSRSYTSDRPRISAPMLVELGQRVAADPQGYKPEAHNQKALIAARCDVEFPRADKRPWKWVGGSDRAIFRAALNAADSPVVTPKAKATAKATGKGAHRVKGSPEAKAWGQKMAAARAAKSGKAPAKATAKAPASGKLTTAERDAKVAQLLRAAAELLAS